MVVVGFTLLRPPKKKQLYISRDAHRLFRLGGGMQSWPTDELELDALVPLVAEFLEVCTARERPRPEAAEAGQREFLQRLETFRAEISLLDFVRRCVRYLDTDWFSLRFALHYLHDFDALYGITCSNAHLAFASALLVSTKFWHDFTYDLTFYAKVFGTSVQKLSVLERGFWSALQSSLWSPAVQQLARDLEVRLENSCGHQPSDPETSEGKDVPRTNI